MGESRITVMDFIDLKTQYRALKPAIDAQIQRVLDHGQYILGPEVGELEARLAAYTGAAHCVTVASGTVALLISLMALGIGPGDEVITTPCLPVIEDAAQSFGATYKGRRSCNLSAIGCTSFFPSKPLGCYGDGGAIFTSDDALAKAMREIRIHGQERRYVHTRIGVGGRMDTLQCAVLLAKLDRFDWEVEQRARLGESYARQLREVPNVTLFTLRPDRTSVHAQYTIRVPNREAVLATLAARGIPTAVHYPVPLNQQPAYAGFCCPDCTPVAARLADEVFSLPMHPWLSAEDQERIVGAVRDATT